MGRLLLSAVVVLAATFCVVPTAAAQEAGHAANTLRVAPLRTDVTLEPGQSRTVRLTVTNPTDQTVAVTPVQNDFVAEGEDGVPAIILGQDSFAPNHSLKRLLEPLETITIPARDSRTIEVVIRTAATTAPGGYFGAIRFTPTHPDSGGQVSLNVSVASMILLRVAGDASEQLQLTDFALEQNGLAATFFTDTTNLSVLTRFTNQGDVQLAPRGKVTILKMGNVVHEVDFNNKSQHDLVLPDSSRRWSVPVEGVDGFGRYTLTGTFTYGSANQTVEVTQTFWVVPYQVMAMVAGGAVLVMLSIGYGVWRWRRARVRSYRPRRRR